MKSYRLGYHIKLVQVPNGQELSKKQTSLHALKALQIQRIIASTFQN